MEMLTARPSNRMVSDGDVLLLGELEMRVIHTLGYTPARVTYSIGDAAFIGDSLFMPDYGTARADIPGGDAARLYRSIRKLHDLPRATRLFTGHDYPPPSRANPAWEATVAKQRAQTLMCKMGSVKPRSLPCAGLATLRSNRHC